MPLRHPGKNAPLDDEARQKLFALGEPVDVATAPLRTDEPREEARPYTFDEMSKLIRTNIARLSPFRLPWDERHASALADLAVNVDAHVAVVLLAGSGRHEEARALYDRMYPDRVITYPYGGGHAALAAGDFRVPDPRVAVVRLSTMGTIVRFRPIADKIAAAAETLLATLPEFFAANSCREKFIEIWTPTLRTFALLAETDDQILDDGYATRLAELAGVPVRKHQSFTVEDKREAFRTMFTLAMHQRRLVSAHRIASRLGPTYGPKYQLLVAVEYVKAGDLAGAWEITRKLTPTTGGRFDHLAQTLRERPGDSTED